MWTKLFPSCEGIDNCASVRIFERRQFSKKAFLSLLLLWKSVAKRISNKNLYGVWTKEFSDVKGNFSKTFIASHSLYKSSLRKRFATRIFAMQFIRGTENRLESESKRTTIDGNFEHGVSFHLWYKERPSEIQHSGKMRKHKKKLNWISKNLPSTLPSIRSAGKSCQSFH